MAKNKIKHRIFSKEHRDSLADSWKFVTDNRTGIVLSDKVVNGSLKLDESCLREIKNNFADVEMSFVAVNAPFMEFR